MSLDLINHKLTTSTTDSSGVVTWSNPNVNVKITSNGIVIGKKGLKVPCSNGAYSVGLKKPDGKWKSWAAVFSSLYSRMVLGLKLQGSTLILKDLSKGYVDGNVSIVSLTEVSQCKTGKMYGHTVKKGSLDTPKELPTKKEDIEKLIGAHKQYYTLYEAKNEHTTEDGAVFPTKELAEWHQTKVTKGKGNAQVVLDYNGGYVLAEQIYLQEVVYNKAKPYTNFIDVLNNNQGIVSVVQEEHCVFDKLDNEHGLSTVQLNLFGLDKVINLPCTKVQAEKINTSLNKYSEAFSKLEDEHKTLKDLLKQVS